MKSIEKFNQVKTLKSLIAKKVDNHKATKKIARMSSLSKDFNEYNTSRAQWTFMSERCELFVMYTAYYILRHDLDDAATKDYFEQVYNQLRPEKRYTHGNFEYRVEDCIEKNCKIKCTTK
jgi:hypothetical protein